MLGGFTLVSWAASIGLCVYVLLPKKGFRFSVNARRVDDRRFEWRDDEEESRGGWRIGSKECWQGNKDKRARSLLRAGAAHLAHPETPGGLGLLTRSTRRQGALAAALDRQRRDRSTLLSGRSRLPAESSRWPMHDLQVIGRKTRARCIACLTPSPTGQYRPWAAASACGGFADRACETASRPVSACEGQGVRIRDAAWQPLRAEEADRSSRQRWRAAGVRLFSALWW